MTTDSLERQPGFGRVFCWERRRSELLSQPHPALRKHNGIPRILRIETHRGWKSETAGMKIDELTQVGHVLRGFVGDARDVILVDQQGGRPVIGAGHFLNIDHGAVGDAADAVEPFPPLPLQIVGGLRLARAAGSRRSPEPRRQPESKHRDEAAIMMSTRKQNKA